MAEEGSMFRNAIWASSTSSPSSSIIRFLSASSFAIGGETGVGGLRGMHPMARLVASIVELMLVVRVDSIEAMSLRSDRNMRTGSGSADSVYSLQCSGIGVDPRITPGSRTVEYGRGTRGRV